MKPGALIRMQMALNAAKRAEMARLAVAVAEVAHHRTESARLRAAAAESPPVPPCSAFDLDASVRWQRHLASRADEEEAHAIAADRWAEAIRAALGKALGRELAVSRLIERNRREEDRRLERAV